MKRTDALKLIANQLNFLNGKFEGFETELSEEDLNRANVILSTLEIAGMQPPNVKLSQLVPGELNSDEAGHYYACWEPEER